MVIVNCPKEGTTWTKAMEIVQNQETGIKLEDLGINNPNIRKTRAGGFLIEIPRTNGGTERASNLAAALIAKLPSDIRVICPRKRAAIRIAGYDESVTTRQIKAEIAKSAACSESEIEIAGETSWKNGLGAVLARMPLEAAFRIEQKGKIQVGWTTAKIKVLDKRPLQC